MLYQHIDPDQQFSCEAELALLCRILAREGYCDNIAGHVTYAQPDGSMLASPFELLWEELKASDILRIDADGRKISGKWSVTDAIRLHVQAHKVCDDICVAVHNHPRWATIWAGLGRVPPIYDQTSAYITNPTLISEYRGGVNDDDIAREIVEGVGEGGCALLKNHGVFVVGASIRQAHMRAIALEARCRTAWHVEALGNGIAMESGPATKLNHIIDTPHISALPNLWDSAVRRELRLDRSVLD